MRPDRGARAAVTALLTPGRCLPPGLAPVGAIAAFITAPALAGRAALPLLAALLAWPFPAQAQCSVPCTLVWADEFDGTAVDESRWEFQIGNGGPELPGWGNNEQQYYRRENATVANGALTITARKESFGGFPYTSTRLRTLGLADFTYGRFEMRARLPYSPPDENGSTTNGLWPAFWMLHSDPSIYGGWAAGGEIDIMEWIGRAPGDVYGTIHYGGEWPDNRLTGSKVPLPAGTEGDYHVFAIEWDEYEIRWYLDDVLYGEKQSNQWFSGGPAPLPLNPPPAPFNIDFHLLLNLAVAGNFPGPTNANTIFPAEFVIDYVRVYELPPAVLTETKFVLTDLNDGDASDDGFARFGNTAFAPDLDVPPADGGSYSLAVNSSGNNFYGGVRITRDLDLGDYDRFTFWINPDPGQAFSLAVLLQEDDTGDGVHTPAVDDEFEFICEVSPSGPCAVAGGGWQRIDIPFEDFHDDNPGNGNDVLDAVPVSAQGNGQLRFVLLLANGTGPGAASYRTDYWAFRGPAPSTVDSAQVPFPLPAMALFAAALAAAGCGVLVRRSH